MNGCSLEEIEQLAELAVSNQLAEVTNVTQAPTPTDEVGAETRRHMGWLFHWRTQRAAFGEEFATRVLNPLTMAVQRGQNFITTERRRFHEALEPLNLSFKERWVTGVPLDKRKRLGELMELVDKNGRYSGAQGAYEPREIEAARNVRKLYNEYFEKFGLDPDTYINEYLPHMRRRPNSGLFLSEAASPEEQAIVSHFNIDHVQFYHELRRYGTLQDYDQDIYRTFDSYIRGLSRTKIVKPVIEQLDKDVVDDYFNRRLILMNNPTTGQPELTNLVNNGVGYQHWLNLKDHIFGKPAQRDLEIMDTFQQLVTKFAPGKQVSPDALYNISRLTSSMFYAGVLGSPFGTRPASLIRHATRLISSFSSIGEKYVVPAMKKAWDSNTLAELEAKGILSSPFEQMGDKVSASFAANKLTSGVPQTFLYLFSAADRKMRAVTAIAARDKFDDYLSRGMIRKLPMRNEPKKAIMELVEKGEVDKARDSFITENVATLEYYYGPANRPEVFRSALGNLMGVLMSYPMNATYMYKLLATEAREGITDFMRTKDYNELKKVIPFFKQLAIVSGLMTAGMEAGVDLTQTFVHGLMPTGLPIMEGAIGTYQTGETTARWILGNVYQTGEDNFQHEERKKAYKRASEFYTSMVPGRVFASDVARIVSEPTLTSTLHGLGFPPLAEERNRIRKERLKLKRYQEGD